MMRKLIIFGIVFFMGGSALACDSYEECMDSGNWASVDTPYLKAIAYKLNEISKKLDNSTLTPDQKKRLDIEDAVIKGRDAWEGTTFPAVLPTTSTRSTYSNATFSGEMLGPYEGPAHATAGEDKN